MKNQGYRAQIIPKTLQGLFNVVCKRALTPQKASLKVKGPAGSRCQYRLKGETFGLPCFIGAGIPNKIYKNTSLQEQEKMELTSIVSTLREKLSPKSMWNTFLTNVPGIALIELQSIHDWAPTKTWGTSLEKFRKKNNLKTNKYLEEMLNG